jgi:hypothetical protein
MLIEGEKLNQKMNNEIDTLRKAIAQYDKSVKIKNLN